MQVVDHEPHAWFLLEDGEKLFLDCHCSHSFFDYTVLIELDDSETSRFRAEGRDYLNKLAYDVHYSAPAVRGNRSPYKHRNLSVQNSPLDAAAQVAITAWVKANRPTG